MKLLKSLFERVKNNKFVLSVFSVGSGRLISQFISVLTVPLLARIYDKEAYGDYAIVVSTATIVVSIVCMGLSAAIMKAKDDEETRDVLCTDLCISIALSSLLFIITTAISPFFRLYSINGSYLLSLLLMLLYVVATAANSFMHVFVNKKGLNKLLLINPIIGAVSTLIISVPCGLLRLGYIGFMIASIASAGICTVQMILRSKPDFKSFSFSRVFQTISTYRRYIMYVTPADVTNNLSSQYPTQFLSRMYDSTVLGDYSMCVKLIQYPIQLIASPIATIYFRTASEYNKEGKDLAGFTYKIISRILIASVLPVLAVILFGKQLFTLFLGSNWAGAGVLAGFLIFRYVLLFCTTCLSYLRVSVGKQQLNFWFSLVNLAIIIISCLIGKNFADNLYYLIMAISIGCCISDMINLVVDFWCLKKFYVRILLILVPYAIVAFGLVVLLL